MNNCTKASTEWIHFFSFTTQMQKKQKQQLSETKENELIESGKEEKNDMDDIKLH